MFHLIPSQDECLKTLYTMDPCGAGLRVQDIVEALEVPAWGARCTLAQLHKQGLTESFGKSRLALTEAGVRRAREIKSRYEIIRLFLVEVLHIHCKIAATEAHKLDHSLNDTSVYAMQKLLEESTDWAMLAQLAPA